MLLHPQWFESISREEHPYPSFSALLPDIEIREGKYLAKFARTTDDLDQILRLRFEVFNLELSEGLDASYATGRDQDAYDLNCHHLAVIDREAGRVVGTYRVQTATMAAAAQGFYSAGEFDLRSLPPDLIDGSIELGRACIAGQHRNTQVLYLLWKGLAAYLEHNRKRYLFGCCSLTSQSPEAGLALYRQLQEEGWVHPLIRVTPRREFECLGEGGGEASPPPLPRLFRTYLRFGAKVCSPPAIDRQFKTIDYIVLFDVVDMNSFSRRMFFGL